MSDDTMRNISDPYIGQTLDSRYTITRRIADGGMASVYCGKDQRLERTVAIKIIHQQLAQGKHKDAFLRRFHDEAKAAAGLHNSHIVQIYDTGEYDGLCYIVMEYIHGVNLRKIIEDTAPLSVRDTLRILGEILDGLSCAHQAGLIHRDIKPENIMVDSRGHIKITDFGLAKTISSKTASQNSLLLGTASYLPPEIIESNTATSQSDLYSVGILGYEMLTGSVPFKSENPMSVVFKHVHNDVPSLTTTSRHFAQPVVSFIASLCARYPKKRPQNASTAAADLQRITSHLSPNDLYFKLGTADKTKSTKTIQKPNVDKTIDYHNTANTATHSDIAEDKTQAFNPSPSDELLIKDGQTKKLDSPQQTLLSKISHHRAITITTSSIIFILIIGLCGWWWFLGPGSYWVVPAAEDKPCIQGTQCSLSGANFSTYQKTLTALNIKYTTEQAFSDTIKNGDIISATPDVGSHISRRNNGSLHLVISSGIKTAQIPENIMNCTAVSSPLDTLQKLDFTAITVTKEYSMTIPQGCAVSITPTPGTTIKHNDALQLTVSEGLKPIQIPDLKGTSVNDAMTKLNELKLNITTTQEYSDSIPAGSVSGTSPEAGTNGHWGDAITVKISQGPQTIKMPNVRGMSKDDATKLLESLGFKVKTETSIYGLLGGTSVVKQSADPDSMVRLRDSSGQPTEITITVI